VEEGDDEWWRFTFVATFRVCLVACDVEDTAFDADADGVAVVLA